MPDRQADSRYPRPSPAALRVQSSRFYTRDIKESEAPRGTPAALTPAGANAVDRRRSIRVPVQAFANVQIVLRFDNELRYTNTMTAEVVDVSVEGLQVVMPFGLGKGTRLWVRTRLRGKLHEFYAMVRRVDLHSRKPLCAYGLVRIKHYL